MVDPRRVGRVIAHALFVADHWPDLVEARVPGTRRPWKQTRTRKESREAYNETAGEWSTGITSKASQRPVKAGLTAAPAPAHVDVLDALTTVLSVSHGLSDAVCQLAGVDRLSPPESVFADPRPYLQAVVEHLPAAAEVDNGWIIDAALDPHDDLSIVRARHQTATCLRLILAGQALDADCPWCGERPLRIRIIKTEPLVVCESKRACEPPESDVGTWMRGRPAWTQPEWDWLANRIRAADARDAEQSA